MNDRLFVSYFCAAKIALRCRNSSHLYTKGRRMVDMCEASTNAMWRIEKRDPISGSLSCLFFALIIDIFVNLESLV